MIFKAALNQNDCFWIWDLAFTNDALPVVFIFPILAGTSHIYFHFEPSEPRIGCLLFEDLPQLRLFAVRHYLMRCSELQIWFRAHALTYKFSDFYLLLAWRNLSRCKLCESEKETHFLLEHVIIHRLRSMLFFMESLHPLSVLPAWATFDMLCSLAEIKMLPQWTLLRSNSTFGDKVSICLSSNKGRSIRK